MIATALKVIEPLLSIRMINFSNGSSCGCGLVVNNRSSGDGVSGSSLCMDVRFSINDHSKYQNTGFLFSNLQVKKKIQ